MAAIAVVATVSRGVHRHMRRVRSSVTNDPSTHGVWDVLQIIAVSVAGLLLVLLLWQGQVQLADLKNQQANNQKILQQQETLFGQQLTDNLKTICSALHDCTVGTTTVPGG
jgi:hypothetical protein